MRLTTPSSARSSLPKSAYHEPSPAPSCVSACMPVAPGARGGGVSKRAPPSAIVWARVSSVTTSSAGAANPEYNKESFSGPPTGATSLSVGAPLPPWSYAPFVPSSSPPFAPPPLPLRPLSPSLDSVSGLLPLPVGTLCVLYARVLLAPYACCVRLQYCYACMRMFVGLGPFVGCCACVLYGPFSHAHRCRSHATLERCRLPWLASQRRASSRRYGFHLRGVLPGSPGRRP